MTRNAQIHAEAKKSFSGYANEPHLIMGFITGANWADRTMAERVADWVEENICDAYNHRGDPISGGKIRDELLKAMEE